MEKMTARESGKHMSYCLKRNIRIYPVPYGSNFKIVVERNGRPKMGDELYVEKTTKTKTGVYDKIWMLYETLAKKMEDKKMKQLVTT